MQSTTKWKSGFLKTGLPLEYVTSKILNEKGHDIFGEYPYIRPNESNELKEFSVDIRTHKCLDSNNRLYILSLLVECKYRQPGTSWVFSPYPSDSMPIGLVHSTEDLVPVRLGSTSLWEFEESIGYCISGVELTNEGSGNTDGPKHGLYQLRFAMPVLLKNSYAHALDHNWSDGRYIDLLCPILVTTAELRVIKPNLNLSDFTDASELDDVTELREAVIINENAGPQLQEFADSLADEFIESRPQLIDRLVALVPILVGKEWESRMAPDVDTIRRSFGQSTERILVVNYASLELVIGKLEKAIMKEIENEKVYGKILDGEDGPYVTTIDSTD